MIRLLFESSRQRGRFALGSPDGNTLSSGQRISVRQEDGEYIPGTVESDGETYAFLPYGTSWIARIPLRAGMSIDDYSTLEELYPKKEGEKEWWEESPEEFASGFTEEVHVHHVESEQKPMTGNKEKQYEALYGPCAKADYSVGDTLAYISPDTHQRVTGVVVWIAGPADVAQRHQPLQYIVESNDRDGFPDVVKQTDIIQ